MISAGIGVLVAVGLFLVGLALVTAAAPIGARRGSGSRAVADPLFILGISFSGVGAALMATVGPGMIGLVAFGVFFLAAGSRRMRNSSHRGMR